MANPISLPLQEKLPRKNTLKRASDLFIFLLLLSLCSYRLLHLNTHGSVWLLALTCESWFTLMWFLMMNSKWNLVDHKTYPDRLIKGMRELPPVDMFVTTADVSLEPAIVTVNTVLSLLAVDYPCHKLACYVSDDGCSPITLYSLIEASKFAQLWVPFCKKYFIRVRAPFMYFSTRPEIPSGVLEEGFLHDWRRMKSDYEELKRKIEEAAKKSLPFPLTGEFAEFSNIERGNHPSIVKVIWENKDKVPNGVPHLVYVAREKRPNQAHHFKAGAMNVLTRVSGVLTNAPFMLNVDCDMFANNPQVILHAMCILLGSKEEKDSGFVQFPQIFYGGLKDDPFGNQMVIANEFILRGIAGIQGPIYGGTGCFHTRKIIYGQPPDTKGTQGQVHEVSRERYGRSWELSKSIVKIMSGMTEETPTFHCNSSNLKAAEEVASCFYEFDTCWGTEVGWIYGSMTEDVLTGLRIHSLGWTSAFCTPQPPAFLGCAPMGGPACLNQWKRWTTGLLQILIGNHSPLLAAVTKKLKFRQCLVYILCSTWASRSIPEFFYSALPAYCLLSGTSFMPKVSDPWILVPTILFIFYNLYTLSEYLSCGLSFCTWWNNQRMQRITFLTASLFGSLGVLLKVLGISETIFEVTRKDQNDSDSINDVDAGRFTFDSSPLFVPATALVLVHLISLIGFLIGVQPLASDASESGLGEVVCSIWVLLSFMPFVKGLFGKGNFGIPRATICKAGALAFLFMHLGTKANR
ncbi:hypothetical protein MRB53_021137 [Persea americana]|uniref:Uncharacterized protein n=1 Tax=Persea americana TaxID=3435 RepID=A0ACC2L3K5_PERAE|nr:hypothetical protein MRB53_021137 [Persea americana]